MEYFAGLDISMKETHICVVDRDGKVVYEAKAATSPAAIAAELAKAPAAQRIVFETGRTDARGLAHLARTGFYKPVHVKSLPAHAVRALIIARKKLVGQRVTLENQIRGLALVFGVGCHVVSVLHSRRRSTAPVVSFLRYRVHCVDCLQRAMLCSEQSRQSTAT